MVEGCTQQVERSPGSAAELPDNSFWQAPQRGVRIRGIGRGTDFALADCCHPVPGDRIVGVQDGKPYGGIDIGVGLAWGRHTRRIHEPMNRLR